jgi:histidyl-tRNA synthetase
MSATITHVETGDFLKKAADVALHYGFAPIEEVLAREEVPAEFENETSDTKNFQALSLKEPSLLSDIASIARKDPVSEKVFSLMKMCARKKMPVNERPILFYYSGESDRSRQAGGERSAFNPAENKAVQFILGVMGTRQSKAEALILKASLSILGDIGHKENCVHINSIGDKDSAGKFTRELVSYFRKNAHLLGAVERQNLKSDIFRVLEYAYKKKNALRDGAPRPLEFLSDKSREHLREVLEYLEADDIPYEIDDRVIGSSKLYSETLFEIHGHREEGDESEYSAAQTLARGGRYDEIGRRMFRIELPTVAIMLESEHGEKKSGGTNMLKKRKQPKVALVQIGFAAKLHSLSIIEMLRKANVPLYHSLSDDKLSGQLAAAEKLEIPYTIIIGQREALDRTVIVRNMSTQYQDTISFNILPEYIKKIKF